MFDYIQIGKKFYDMNNKLWTKTEQKEKACSACGGFKNAVDENGNITHFCYDDIVLSWDYAGMMTEGQRIKIIEKMTEIN